MRSMRVVAFGLVFLFAGAASAADPARVERLLELMAVEASYGQMLALMDQSMLDGVVEGGRQRGLSKEEVEQAQRSLRATAAEVNRIIGWDAVKADFVAVYAEAFTDAEIDAAIAFYSTPEGRAFIERQGELMQRGAEITQRRVMEAMPAIRAAVDKALNEAGGKGR